MSKYLGFFILLISLPVIILISVLILLFNGRPVFFVQKRIGYGGKSFRLYKFRSMMKDAYKQKIKWKQNNPELWAEYQNNNFKLKNDFRITKLGRFLRKTSLDELPQLFNIIRGEMNFIGPRPILLREKKYYGKSFKFYVKNIPGITGLWQVSGRSDTTFNDRIKYDRYYTSNKSFCLNFFILYKTIYVVLFRKGSC